MKRLIIFALLAAVWGIPHRAAAQIFAVRANALAALMATIDLRAEVSVADKWTVDVSGPTRWATTVGSRTRLSN